jgi:serine protease Do
MTGVNQSLPASISVGEELAEVAEQLRRCTVEVRGDGPGRGSGVIWRSDGLIMTNAHVATSPRHTVELADGRAFTAELVGCDRRYDLAMLQIASTALPAAKLRDSSSLRAGELVLAVGNPMGATGAFTAGVVSAAPKAADALMRADIRLAPGNSGGPLADAHGQVVGINSMVVSGFGVAVTSNTVQRFIAGSTRRSIGVTVRPLTVRVGNLRALGLMVIELEAGGPAHLSGLLVGDVVLRVNGGWLHSPEQLSDAIHARERALSLDVLRAGRLQACEVVLARESVAEVA